MKLLSILQSGGAFWVITIAVIALLGWLAYNWLQVRKAGYKSDGTIGKPGMTYEKTPVLWYQNKFTWYIAAIVVAYIAFLLFLKSEYRPYNPAKDGVPQEQTDTTRQAAEEMIKK